MCVALYVYVYMQHTAMLVLVCAPQRSPSHAVRLRYTDA
jgi:hypothetical protein